MLFAPNLVCNLFCILRKVRNKLRTIFCVYNDLCDSSAWLVDSCGVGGNHQSRTRIVKEIINTEKFYVIYLLRIIDIQMLFFTIKRVRICVDLYAFTD